MQPPPRSIAQTDATAVRGVCVDGCTGTKERQRRRRRRPNQHILTRISHRSVRPPVRTGLVAHTQAARRETGARPSGSTLARTTVDLDGIVWTAHVGGREGGRGAPTTTMTTEKKGVKAHADITCNRAREHFGTRHGKRDPASSLPLPDMDGMHDHDFQIVLQTINQAQDEYVCQPLERVRFPMNGKRKSRLLCERRTRRTLPRK